MARGIIAFIETYSIDINNNVNIVV